VVLWRLLGLAPILVTQPNPDLEQACALAELALDATQALSYLVIEQLRNLETLITSHTSSQVVRQFRERLRHDLDARVGFYEWMAAGNHVSSREDA
jgi:hypothetical protein